MDNNVLIDNMTAKLNDISNIYQDLYKQNQYLTVQLSSKDNDISLLSTDLISTKSKLIQSMKKIIQLESQVKLQERV